MWKQLTFFWAPLASALGLTASLIHFDREVIFTISMIYGIDILYAMLILSPFLLIFWMIEWTLLKRVNLHRMLAVPAIMVIFFILAFPHLADYTSRFVNKMSRHAELFLFNYHIGRAQEFESQAKIVSAIDSYDTSRRFGSSSWTNRRIQKLESRVEWSDILVKRALEVGIERDLLTLSNLIASALALNVENDIARIRARRVLEMIDEEREAIRQSHQFCTKYHDNTFEGLPVEVKVVPAFGQIGGEIAFRNFCSDSDHFLARYLRLYLEMEIVSMLGDEN